ncbi:MAG: hypothetical protein JWQ95_5525 [Sphaerisporangium sp.]|nr:hypothetical protein [Sphaerisporangium sp.]
MAHGHSAAAKPSRACLFHLGEGHTDTAVAISRDAGAHWTDISANLPDIPANAVRYVTGGGLVPARQRGLLPARPLAHLDPPEFEHRNGADSRGLALVLSTKCEIALLYRIRLRSCGADTGSACRALSAADPRRWTVYSGCVRRAGGWRSSPTERRTTSLARSSGQDWPRLWMPTRSQASRASVSQPSACLRSLPSGAARLSQTEDG